jgi:hypothetical protein
MEGKKRSITDLEQAAQSMVPGSLSELTRQCGAPNCACATDPARRHGPHLYLRFNAEGKPQSIYVPPEQSEAAKAGNRAWLRFQEISAQIGADNRDRFLHSLQRAKHATKARRAKARNA